MNNISIHKQYIKKRVILWFTAALIFSCGTDNDDTVSQQTNVTFNFNHKWDDTNVTNENFNTIAFTNENGDALSITKLRYLISKITFTGSAGEDLVVSNYHLIDVTNATNLSIMPTVTIPQGQYSNVKFTFGFNNSDNYNQNYPDLNSASWNVPDALGGGYHYMQLEGKFINNMDVETGYAYHAIRAVNTSGETPNFQDTFFEVNLGTVIIAANSILNIEMNIAEWFKNPNTWDLNILNTMLMPNFDAQVQMFQNGQRVFRLQSVQ